MYSFSVKLKNHVVRRVTEGNHPQALSQMREFEKREGTNTLFSFLGLLSLLVISNLLFPFLGFLSR